MPEFMVVLRGGDPELKSYSPSEVQGIMERYYRWVDQLKRDNRYRGGSPIKDGSKLLNGHREFVVIQDGPYAEHNEALTGLRHPSRGLRRSGGSSQGLPGPVSRRIGRSARAGQQHIRKRVAQILGVETDLFRRQAGELTASFARLFGAHHLDLAERVVQETLLGAFRRWPHDGVPEDPRRWLREQARARAQRILQKEGTVRSRILLLLQEFLPGDGISGDAFLSELDSSLIDDEIELLLLCCHPLSLPPAARPWC